ncbi:MAG: alginate export family protein [Myxococcaceae bacterium]|jgi:hypothetical protein|nr:alginate export family protein [Myxococcaceae bacterium]
MRRLSLSSWSVALWATLVASSAVRAEEADGGFLDAAMPADAGVAAPDAGLPSPPPVALGFDPSQTLWGPARKSSGDLFRSAAAAPTEGPLRWTWNEFSLALGVQYLARAEARDNADLRGEVRDFSFGVDHRARVSARASAFGKVGALLELQDVRFWGTEASTVALLPAVGVHQAFVDLKPTRWLDVRIGRQELSYGEDRLIGNLDWAMNARSFNGVFVRASPLTNLTVDGFGMMLKPPAFLTDSINNRFQNSGSYFTGLYVRWRPGKAALDGYALGLLEDPSTAMSGFSPDHNRLTLGGRGQLPVGPLVLLGEGALQLGQTAQKERVLAGAFATRVTWNLPVGLYLLAEFDGATGDGTPGDGVNSTFNHLFPTAHVHFGFMDYVAWQNVLGARGTVGFKKPWLHAWVDVHHLRAWDARGTWFAANGSVFVAADPNRTADVMGNEIDVSVTVPITQALSLAGCFSVFLPGGMAAAQPSGVGRGQSVSTWGFVSIRAQL